MPNGICGGYPISPNTDCRRSTRLASTFRCCHLRRQGCRSTSRPVLRLRALPLQDPAAAAAERERAVTQLGFCGALLNDCVFGPRGRYLDAPEHVEVWSALESLGVPLYLHPGAPPAEQWQVLRGRPEL